VTFYAGRSGCAVGEGPWLFEHRDHVFGLHQRLRCLSACFCAVLSSVGRGLATDLPLGQGVLQNVLSSVRNLMYLRRPRFFVERRNK
jgi:hypothetical protein